MMKAVSENYEELLINVCKALKYEKIKPNQVVCKYGEIGKNFYIILKGKISVLLPKEEKLFLAQDDFYNYILNLKKYKEKEILKKCLLLNRFAFPLEFNEIEWLKGNLKTLRGREYSTPFEDFLYKISREHLIEEVENFDFDIWTYLNFEDNNILNPQKYEQKNTAEEYIINVRPISYQTYDCREVIVYNYYNIVSLKTGDKFGDLALTSSSQKRTASIVSETLCHFGILDKKSYLKCLKDVSDKVKRWNMNFILSQKVFNCVNVNIFQKNYFNHFVLKKLNRGDKLIHEGEAADRIFIIKEGQYEVTVKKSNIELYELIDKLGGESNKHFDSLDLIHENKEYVQLMSKKKSSKIEIINENDIIGLDDMVINEKYIFNIEIISLKGEIFEMKRKFYEKMMENFEEIRNSNKEFCALKRKYLRERLKTIIDSGINFFKTFNSQIKINIPQEFKKLDEEINLNDKYFNQKMTLNTFHSSNTLDNLNNSNLIKKISVKNKKENLSKSLNDLDNNKLYELIKKQYEEKNSKNKNIKINSREKFMENINQTNYKKKNNLKIKYNFSTNNFIPENEKKFTSRSMSFNSSQEKFSWKRVINLNLNKNNITEKNYSTFKTELTTKRNIKEIENIEKQKNIFFKKFEKFKNPKILKKEILNNLLYRDKIADKLIDKKEISFNKINFLEDNKTKPFENHQKINHLSNLSLIKTNEKNNDIQNNFISSDSVDEKKKKDENKNKKDTIVSNVNVKKVDFKYTVTSTHQSNPAYQASNINFNKSSKNDSNINQKFINKNFTSVSKTNPWVSINKNKFINKNIHKIDFNFNNKNKNNLIINQRFLEIEKKQNNNKENWNDANNYKNFCETNYKNINKFSKPSKHSYNNLDLPMLLNISNDQNKSFNNSPSNDKKMNKNLKNKKSNKQNEFKFINIKNENINPKKNSIEKTSLEKNKFLEINTNKINLNSSQENSTARNFEQEINKERLSILSHSPSIKELKLDKSINQSISKINESKSKNLLSDDNFSESEDDYILNPEINKKTIESKDADFFVLDKNRNKINYIYNNKENQIPFQINKNFKENIINKEKLNTIKSENINNINKNKNVEKDNDKEYNATNINNNLSVMTVSVNSQNKRNIFTKIKNKDNSLSIIDNGTYNKNNNNYDKDHLINNNLFQVNENLDKNLNYENLNNETKEDKSKFIHVNKRNLIDELDKVTSSTRFNNYSNHNLNRRIYDRVFSDMLELDKNENEKEKNHKKENVFIDYLAVEKFNEVYNHSLKKTFGNFGFFPNKSLTYKDHNESIPVRGSWKPFENNKILKFGETLKFKSTSLSKFSVIDKTKNYFMPKKIMTITTSTGGNIIKKVGYF